MELSSTSADAAAVGSPTRAATLYRLEPRAAVVEELFHELMTQRNLRHTARRRVPSGATLLADLGEFRAVVTASDLFDGARATFLLEHDAGLVSIVELLDGAAWIRVAGATSKQVVDVAEQLRELLLAPEPDEQLTRVTLWSKADCAPPRSITRDITAADWASIDDNYAAGARIGMRRLIPLDSCPDARLILWHGPPGTGKTHALRALARAWAPWCSTHYVSDPEKLLNDVASYLLEVVTAREVVPRGKVAPTKLIVLEDAGELMSTTARAEAGRGLSRVLNLNASILVNASVTASMECSVKASSSCSSSRPMSRLAHCIRRLLALGAASPRSSSGHSQPTNPTGGSQATDAPAELPARLRWPSSTRSPAERNRAR